LLVGAYFYQRNIVKGKPEETDATAKNQDHEQGTN
jgi:hypothetical protein